ncbi:hypothetical protein IL306_004397, partial [Fusarium sp. DS 682]
PPRPPTTSRTATWRIAQTPTGVSEQVTSRPTLTRLTPATNMCKSTSPIPSRPIANSISQYDVTNSEAIGGNQLNQTVNGLDTQRLYRLSAYTTVFNTPAPVKDSNTNCVIQALSDSTILAQWPLDFTTEKLGTYKENSVNFTPGDEDVTITLRLRCSDGKKVTISVGLDDVSMHDIGPKLVG